MANQRLLSLDTFRGMTVALMIMVNNPGDWGHIYAPLEHAEWNGCTPTDLVFPFFLFMVGVAIPFALEKQKDDKLSFGLSIRKILIRSLKLFGLGLFLAAFPRFDLPDVRIMGVLQRIAVVYLFCSILFLTTEKKTLIILFSILLVAYYLLITLLPVPDAGAANLVAETNLGAWIDRLILGQKHLYRDAPWDPEGLFSTLPAIATGISGVLAGKWLHNHETSAAVKTTWLFLWGCIGLVVGWVWNEAGFPINKSLWTSSYVCWTSGMAACILASCYWLIDIKEYKRWTKPFVVYGVNAITVFFLSGLLVRIMSYIKILRADGSKASLHTWLYETLIQPHFTDPKNASLVGAITFILIWLAILTAMYNKRVIVKV